MEDETPMYKEELLRLIAEKKIKYTVKYIEKATDKTLKKICHYQKQELDQVNGQVTGLIISKMLELMENLEWVKDNISLEKDLDKNELFKRDVKKIIDYLTPYIPMVRLISGGVTIGAHVADKKLNGRAPFQDPSKEEPEKTS